MNQGAQPGMRHMQRYNLSPSQSVLEFRRVWQIHSSGSKCEHVADTFLVCVHQRDRNQGRYCQWERKLDNPACTRRPWEVVTTLVVSLWMMQLFLVNVVTIMWPSRNWDKLRYILLSFSMTKRNLHRSAQWVLRSRFWWGFTSVCFFVVSYCKALSVNNHISRPMLPFSMLSGGRLLSSSVKVSHKCIFSWKNLYYHRVHGLRYRSGRF